MHTMNRRMAYLVVIGITLVAGLLAGCGIGGSSAPTPTPTAAPTRTLAPTPTLAPLIVPPTNTPVSIPPTPLPLAATQTPLPNLSMVKLTARELPAGFQDAPLDSLRKATLTEDALTTAFQSAGVYARVINLTGFQHAQKNQLVVFFLVYPLLPSEKTALDAQLATPETALKTWGNALLGAHGVANARLLTNVDKFGDKSVGFTTVVAQAGMPVRADTVMISRGAAVQVVLSYYPDNTTPVAVTELAKLYDARLATTLTPK